MKFVNVNYILNDSVTFKTIAISPEKIETMEKCHEPRGVQTHIVFESGTQLKVSQSISEIIARTRQMENT